MNAQFTSVRQKKSTLVTENCLEYRQLFPAVIQSHINMSHTAECVDHYKT